MPQIAILNVDIAPDGASPEVTLRLHSDGSIEFTDLQGNKVVAHSNIALRKLYEKIAASD
jgi:hypothetical protein